LPHIPGALLRASTARGAPPDIFALDFGQAKSGFADDLAHAELPDLVPGAHCIAQAALKAPLEVISAACLDYLNDFLVWGYSFHDLYRSFTRNVAVTLENLRYTSGI
jgi:hypothetical protein